MSSRAEWARHMPWPRRPRFAAAWTPQMERQGGVCWLCGKPLSMRHKNNTKLMVSRDHVFPVSTNGYRIWPFNNILLAHKACNTSRPAHQVPACALFWLENCARGGHYNHDIGLQAIRRVKALMRYKAKVLPNGHAVWEINRDIPSTMPKSKRKGGKGQREAA